MGARIGKTDRIIALIVALGTALMVTVAASTTAWSQSGEDGSGAGQSAFPQAEPPPGFQSKYAEVNGFRMHYVQGGKGSPVVLIHGFPQTWAEWRNQMGPLSENHTVIAVDLRGMGDSELTKSGYQTAQMAGDVHELLKQLKLNNGVQLVGHDIGLWVSYAYAAQWPSEVRRMAVMEAPVPDESIYTFPALEADPNKPSAWHFGMFQLPLAEQLITGHERAFVEGFVGEYLGNNKSAFTPADYDFYAHYLKRQGRTTAWMSLYRQLREDIRQNAKFAAEGKLRMPILAIGGSESFGSGIADQWRKYAVNVDGRVLEGSGHWVTEEKPQEVTALLQSFLETSAGTQPSLAATGSDETLVALGVAGATMLAGIGAVAVVRNRRRAMV
ncbi:alpha/beta hydrolase [Actinacidiphila glaucinigra]|uniref:alpha/beta fold hydrolase n=1 Tax=Actinacidiphila glaucinigra TaxID=235986 RepID=UPI00386AFFBA